MSKVTFTFDEDALEQHDRETRQALARELLEDRSRMRPQLKTESLLDLWMLGKIREIAGEGR